MAKGYAKEDGAVITAKINPTRVAYINGEAWFGVDHGNAKIFPLARAFVKENKALIEERLKQLERPLQKESDSEGLRLKDDIMNAVHRELLGDFFTRKGYDAVCVLDSPNAGCSYLNVFNHKLIQIIA